MISNNSLFYFQWHFTNNCNLRCQHCYQKLYNSEEPNIDKLLIVADTIEKTLKKWNIKGRISLTGGEPFLYPHILKNLIEYLSKSDYIEWIGILSNGTLTNDDFLDSLKKYPKLKEIQISLDGATALTHDKIREKKSFQKAIQTISKLIKAGFYTTIMYTLSEYNCNEVLDAIDLVNEMNVDAISIERLTPENKNQFNEICIPSNKLKKIYQLIYEKKKNIEKVDDKLKIRVSRPLWNLINKNIGGFCPVGYSCLTILEDGIILPCRRLEIPLGNIFEDSIFKIWYTSKVLWEIRNKNNIQGKCKKCDNFSLCGGCRAAAYAYNKNYLDEDPQCWK